MLMLTTMQSASKGRRDFGSFYSSNLDEMLNISEAEYDPPAWPVSLPDLSEAADTDFGTEMREKYFLQEPGWSYLNHGAFGAALKPAVQFSQALQMYSEAQPARWFDRDVMPLLARVTRRMAKFVHCHPANLVLIENATVGSCSVIENQHLKSGDTICYFNIVYPAVKKQLRHWCASNGAKINEVELTFPIKSEEEILSKFEEGLSHPGTKFAVVDHIPSATPFRMPVKKMAAMCRERNIRLLVDGAHALGSVDLRLEEWDVDYYVANAHKWPCAPKGCAILYCRPELQSTLHSVIVSHGYGFGLAGEFFWAGTKDYHSLMSLEVVMDFWQTVGVEKIRSHITEQSRKARKYLCDLWKTDYMVPDELVVPLTNVQLPLDLYRHCSVVDYARAEYFGDVLHKRYKVEIPVKNVENHLYVRVSYHVYNTWQDVVRLGEAVMELTRENILQDCETMKVYE